MKSAYRYLLAVCLTLVLGFGALACADNPPPEPPPPPPPAPEAPPPPPPPPPEPPPPPPPVPLTPEELFARMSLEELNSTSPLDPVFFDLDMAELLSDGQAALRRNADWMRQWDSTRVRVEGHCDERGTNEYNLALGERRAAAVRDYLVSLGIPANRIATTSRGEESPFCTDSHEGCWSRNRRGHFFVTAK